MYWSPFWTLELEKDVRDTVADHSVKFTKSGFRNLMCFNAVSRIALVSPERSRQIEAILLRMAQQSGQIRGRITENQLIELLEQVRK
jgi:hypothetical protein